MCLKGQTGRRAQRAGGGTGEKQQRPEGDGRLTCLQGQVHPGKEGPQETESILGKILFSFPGAAVTSWVVFNGRNLFFPSSGRWKSNTQVQQGYTSSRGPSEGPLCLPQFLVMPAVLGIPQLVATSLQSLLLPAHGHFPFVGLCLQISLSL